MFSIALCDDSKQFLEYEKSIIDHYMLNEKRESQCDTFLSGEHIISQGTAIKKYNLFILDYDMEGLTGFDTANRIYELYPGAKIAFATNYYDFTREGYKYNAVRYLVKQEATFRTELFECIDTVYKQGSDKKLLLELSDRNEEVAVDDILFIKSDKHYVHYHFSNMKLDNNMKRCSLDDAQAELPNCFIRIHLRYIVNLKKATKITRFKVIVKDDDNRIIELPIARNRYDEVNKRFCLMKGEF